MRIAILVFLTVLFPFTENEQKKKIPNVNGWRTNLGEIKQRGPDVIFSGHHTWDAEGFFRRDGKLALVWINLNEECLAYGLYELQGEVFIGSWGYEDQVKWVPDIFKGKLEGTLSLGHSIFKVPEQEYDWQRN